MNSTDIGPDIGFDVFGEGPDAWLEISLDMYGALVGEAVIGLLVGSAIMIAMYVHSNDMALPTVVLILFSTVLFGALPGDYQQTAMGVMIIGIAAAVFEVMRRYVW